MMLGYPKFKYRRLPEPKEPPSVGARFVPKGDIFKQIGLGD
jgi:hypothetical protein